MLSNAAKYSPKADEIIIILSSDRDKITVGVQDFGIGISSEYHTKIFERFFRVTGEDEKTYPGMGIGLHVSTEIIAHHHGKLWVESERYKGSTFYFTVPIEKE